MISQKTAREVKGVLVAWGKEHSVTPLELLDLFSRMGAVPGNQSFKDSIDGLYKLFFDELQGKA